MHGTDPRRNAPCRTPHLLRRFVAGVLALLGLSGTLSACGPVQAGGMPFRAGVSARVITPTEPMWMAGYGARNRPAEGKLQDLHVKALALEDAAGHRLVLLTSDLVGLPRGLSEAVAHEVERRTGLPRERLLLTCSHTHCGPVVRGSLNSMYDMPPEQWRKVDAYTQRLHGSMVDVITAALADLKPARLAVGSGTARFAVNRRQPTAHGIINGYNAAGPVDHAVPVLRVESPTGTLRAVVFGYACHNTTLQFYRWCGDYAGFAQADLEAKHPGAQALFWIGCGADANPLPRGTVALCRQYGRELADAVESVLGGPLIPVQGTLAARYGLVDLPLDAPPTQEQLAGQLLSKEGALRRRAARLIQALNTKGKIEDHYPYYPIQVWRLGGQVLWIALGGEVVVDYDLRLKQEFAGRRAVWITGYANDVMAYIPSRRVLREGGYEADSSMIYYGMPSKWAPPVEDKIVARVHELAREVQAKEN